MVAANSVLSANKSRRGIGRPWAKGCSGNPSGRPRTTADIREQAQAYGPAAINRLAMMAGLAVDALGQPITGAESEAAQLVAIRLESCWTVVMVVRRSADDADVKPSVNVPLAHRRVW
jgi:hypothetical protein